MCKTFCARDQYVVQMFNRAIALGSNITARSRNEKGQKCDENNTVGNLITKSAAFHLS